jgi:hypothetical protein
MNNILNNNLFLFIIAMIWVLPWKGYCSCGQHHERGHKRWFIALHAVEHFRNFGYFLFILCRKEKATRLNSFVSFKNLKRKTALRGAVFC